MFRNPPKGSFFSFLFKDLIQNATKADPFLIFFLSGTGKLVSVPFDRANTLLDIIFEIGSHVAQAVFILTK